ncbi:MAG: carbonic anhydrase [Paracoccaceae bacterium]|jgi:carbonic anhydrase|nr:carbonic anhydrase [Paracoccaceae bacterium]MDP7186500.1 carbonic anhydrase [Paracoccaceae bacterium]
MQHAKPLPAYLVERYHEWNDTTYVEKKGLLHKLADEGQHPAAMVIACCDSRVHVTSLFGVDQGDFFLHRNIANLVPPYEPDGGAHGTSAAIEFAVTELKVRRLIVMGHSKCGGVQGCLDMCAGHAPQLEEQSSFVGRWMDALRPGYERVKDMEPGADQSLALEKVGVQVSLENLMTFPFVAERVHSGDLDLHGLWYDIRDGIVECYDAESGEFKGV